jgi:hypothetical protein
MTTKPEPAPPPDAPGGWLHLDGWAGRTRHRVEILGETPRRLRVRLVERAYRHPAGKVLRAPRHAVVRDDPAPAARPGDSR